MDNSLNEKSKPKGNTVSNNHLDLEQLFDTIKDYVIASFLIHLSKNRDLNYLDDILLAINRTIQDFYMNEVKEIASLCNEKESMTIGRLVRFKYRITIIVFLKWMGVSEDEFKHLSDDELAEFIVSKFDKEEFRDNAKRLFFIE